MRDSVVLLSGGLDSTVVAAGALAAGRLHSCISIRYGQPHMEPEMMASRRWCDIHGVHREVLDAPMPSSAAMRLGSGAPGARVVPGRNLVLVAYAVQYAATVGARTVLLGACADDAADYPDCRAEFVDSASALASTYGIAVAAPLLGMTKPAVVALARTLGVNIAETWSCYEPRMVGFDFMPCGGCNACRLRLSATSAAP